jgi:hypothetical protein
VKFPKLRTDFVMIAAAILSSAVAALVTGRSRDTSDERANSAGVLQCDRSISPPLLSLLD